MTNEELCAIVGRNIRRERLARKMSIKELAKCLKVSTAYMGLIERGKRGTTALNLFKLAVLFDKSIPSFFTHRIILNDLRLK